MSQAPLDVAERDDGLRGPLSDCVSLQTYSLNTSLGVMHMMSRVNNEMSFLEDIASGTFGVVKKGTLDLDQQCYALKQTKRAIYSEGDLQRRLQEVYTLSVCNHPNILRYFDGWVENSAVYVRTEWLADGSVADFCRPISETLLRSVIQQVAAALHWLSCHYITHRDVKPENILARRMEDGSYVFKLADFGLARPFKNNFDVGNDFWATNDEDGDQRYLCPATLASSEFYPQGGEADVYALGASCVELMGGDPSRVRCGQYTGDFSKYSPEIQQLVRWMTQRDPKERPDAFTLTRLTLDPEVTSCDEFLSFSTEVDELRKLVADLEHRLMSYDGLIDVDD